MTFRRLSVLLADAAEQSAREQGQPHIYVRNCPALADAIKGLGGVCETFTTRNSVASARLLGSSHTTQETWSVTLEKIRVTATKNRAATAAECAAAREDVTCS